MHVRLIQDFNRDWLFQLGDIKDAQNPTIDDADWRQLDVPHDWSIEGEFSSDHPATTGGGALPGGIGWYRKTFHMSSSLNSKLTFVEFDGIYMNSEVWINGHYLGKRPSGYISFSYDLSPYLHYGSADNVIAVRVDNSLQPNSRWYSGSGIYRNVRLVTKDVVYVDQWGVYVTTHKIGENSAQVIVETTIRNESDVDEYIFLKTEILNSDGNIVAIMASDSLVPSESQLIICHALNVANPERWSIENPSLYKAVTSIEKNGMLCDDVETPFGIRSFRFDPKKGFFLNGQPTKIKGVCNHHDLGSLGAAMNTRALERQLEILKAMGCNSIRTAHNPPTPELLDLCDRMGFIVMDEMFDMWKKNKSPHDYSLYWDEWHERDLRDFILRDRNHPSVIIWSIGNEILEQWDESGIPIARELAAIVRELDPTRPITSGCNETAPYNNIIKSGALDVIGFNYHHDDFEPFPENYPGQAFVATETNSALATRGYYDMPSDSVRRWPIRWDIPFTDGNPDNTCSAYDNCSAYWGSTHEETWKIVRKYNFLSGIYIWTGFDYLGEPTPYSLPSRSSYFGVIDLAGFPKDGYYFYQAEWTDDPVLHLFPHWNWEPGETVDVWAYTNCGEVELFLNGESLGIQKKTDDQLHLVWRVQYRPGILRAIGKKDGEILLEKEVHTAGKPAQVVLLPDRKTIQADGRDLSFVTIQIQDEDGNLCPRADHLVQFHVEGEGTLRAVDNGLQTSHESFQASERKAFNGLCLAVIQSTEKAGKIQVSATVENLPAAETVIKTK
ncbi:DUF4982 domain-containing protein [candidate division KSB1 bacterium]|nr:DUF4982 domain-containing protein [candidate division KSB1 bacterium]